MPPLALPHLAKTTEAGETVRILEWYGDDTANIGIWSTSNNVDGSRILWVAIAKDSQAYHLGFVRLEP